jgi:hypothetical protein
MQTAGVNRWFFICSNTAEGGADAGSNLSVVAYTDAGSIVDTPISITRSAGGAINLARPVSCSSTLSASSLTATGLTSGRLPYVTTGGLLVDSANLLAFSDRISITRSADDYTGLIDANYTGANAVNTWLRSRRSGVTRWDLYGALGAEGGSDTGSDVCFQPFTDAGVGGAYCLYLMRSDGSIGMGVTPTAGAGRIQLFGGTTVANAVRFGETPIYRTSAGTLVQDYTANLNTTYTIKNTNASNGTSSRFIADNGTVTAGFMIRGTGDASTPNAAAIYVTGSNPIQLFTNSVERCRIIGTGEMGVGVTPTGGNGLLQLASGTTVANAVRFGETPIYRNAAGQIFQAYAQNGATYLSILNNDAGASATARFIVDNGTTTAGMQLDGTGRTEPGRLVIYTSGAAAQAFQINGAEKARFNVNGLLVGATASIGSEIARFAGGTISTPTATDVTVGGGSLNVGSGALTVGINATSGSAIVINAATGTNRLTTFQTAGSDRWKIGANGTAEGGANAGSPFIINAYTDAGVFIDITISITRAAGGAVAIARPLTVTGLITTGSAVLMASSVALTNGAAAAAGTLANAPAAGNPTKWIPINDNGTTRYIPAW